MANNLFKLIKSKTAASLNKAHVKVSRAEQPLIDVHALIRCSTEDARAYIPHQLAEQLAVLPLAIIEMQNRKLLTIAAETITPDLQKTLEFACSIEVKLIPLNNEVIRRAIFLAYQGSEQALMNNMQKLNAISLPLAKNAQKVLSSVKCEVNDFLKTLITFAIVKKASDIHLIPAFDGLKIKLRIDGELRSHENAVCSAEIYKRVVSRIKTLSNLDITQHDVTHDGSIAFDLEDQSVSIRISIMPTIHGEKIVLRLHGIKDIIKLENLGLDQKTFDFISTASNRPQGLIICAGSTGSGKSTTLYAILEKLSSNNKNIITVEDPVEIKLPFASQTSINSKRGIGYVEALKASLRQDPDCIMIGELRDKESVKIAFEAALTGHLVITSLHAGNVSEALQRLLGFGIDRVTLSQTLSLIVQQKLLPKLCNSCKVFDLNGTRSSGETVLRLVGCEACDYSGYQSRVIACESLMLDDKIKQSLVSHHSSTEIRKHFTEDNYSSIEENLKDLLLKGDIEFRPEKEEPIQSNHTL